MSRRIEEGKKRKSVTFCVTPDEEAILDRNAAELGLSRSAYLRFALIYNKEENGKNDVQGLKSKRD